MFNSLCSEVLEKLLANENSASAHALVLSLVEQRDLSDDEVEEIYSADDDDNDIQTARLLEEMNSAELEQLLHDLEGWYPSSPTDEFERSYE
jgi:hypothetical protein